MTTSRLLAGASGYSFKEWKGNFYPEKIKAEEMLAWYAERLPTVEINNTFYRMPKTAVLETWAGTTPEASGSRSRHRAGSRISPGSRSKPRPSRWAISTGTWQRSAPSAARCCSSCRRT